MPTHLYSTAHEPPRLIDRVLAHAVELSLAAFSLLAGLVVLFNAPDYSGLTTTPLPELPSTLALSIGAFVGVGGLVTIIGGLIRRPNVRSELNIEQTGWIIMAAGWGTYGWAAIHYTDGATLSYLFAGTIAVGAAVRTLALIAREHDLEAAATAGEGGDAEAPEEGADDGEL